MSRVGILIFGILAVLLLPHFSTVSPPSAHGVSESDVYVNVLWAKSGECGDAMSGADLRVSGYREGENLFVTPEATDAHKPFFGSLHRLQNFSIHDTLTIALLERDTIFFAADDETCDIAPGDSQTLNLTWDGRTQLLQSKGDGRNRAELALLIGTDPPLPPKARVTNVTEHQALLSWTPLSHADRYEVRRGDGESTIEELESEEREFQVRGLRDNTRHALRVVAVREPWRVSSEDVYFKTKNAPPNPPAIKGVWREDASRLVIAIPRGAPPEATRLQVYVGPEGNLTLNETSLRWDRKGGAGHPYGGYGLAYLRGIDLGPNDQVFRLRVVDDGGQDSLGPMIPIPDEVFEWTDLVLHEAVRSNGSVVFNWSWDPPPQEWHAVAHASTEANFSLSFFTKVGPIGKSQPLSKPVRMNDEIPFVQLIVTSRNGSVLAKSAIVQVTDVGERTGGAENQLPLEDSSTAIWTLLLLLVLFIWIPLMGFLTLKSRRRASGVRFQPVTQEARTDDNSSGGARRDDRG